MPLNSKTFIMFQEPLQGVILSSEEEMRKLLKIREDLEKRTTRLKVEIEDLRKAIAEIDRNIVRQGFRQPMPAHTGKTPSENEGDGSKRSVKSKDGMTLGYLRAEEDVIIFEPILELGFTLEIPPFKSFFLERVLDNMRITDEGKVNQGELSPDDIISYEIDTEGIRIIGITIRNYGGERRLSEILSSMRWAFDKMYEKLEKG